MRKSKKGKAKAGLNLGRGRRFLNDPGKKEIWGKKAGCCKVMTKERGGLEKVLRK